MGVENCAQLGNRADVDAIPHRAESKGGLYPPSVTPPPHPLPLLRFLFRFVRNPLSSLPQAVYEEPLVVYNTGRSQIVWVTAPRLVEEVLLTRGDEFPKNPLEKRVLAPTLGDVILTSEGPLWRWQRRVMAPLFRHAEILRYVPTMTGAAVDQITRWRRDPPGSVQQIDRDMTDTTLAVIARTMLAGGEPQETSTIRSAGNDYLDATSWEIAYGLLRLPTWLPHPRTWQMRRAAHRLRAAVRNIVVRRRGAGGSDADLLGRLLSARDPETGEPMTEDQLVNNLLTLLEAGHETTAKALTWALYLLARSPEWQDRLRSEVAEVAGSEPVSGSHIDQLRLTQQVLKEAMRLYPPAPVMIRYVPRTVALGDVTLKAGTTVIIPIFAIHRHRALWNDPDRFDPARFELAQEATYRRTQYMPFGAGPRICIGMSFAMAEATAIIATLVRAARFEWDGRHLPEPVSRVTLRPKGGMPLKVSLL
jgi:cytochrome P450